MTTAIFVAAKVNATDYGDLSDGGTVSSPSVGAISFGAYAANTSHFDIRNVAVGTGGYGSSDLFDPILNDLSEFDGVFGNDGSIVASGGVLSVDSGAGDHYGYKAIAATVGPIYFQFQLRVRTGDGSADYVDIWDAVSTAATNGGDMDGIFNGGGHWQWDGPGLRFGGGPSGDPIWDTVNLTFSLVALPPPTVPFHIAS